MKAVVLFIGAFFFISMPSDAAPASQGFINATLNGKKIEFFWMKPEGQGPFPAILLNPDQD